MDFIKLDSFTQKEISDLETFNERRLNEIDNENYQRWFAFIRDLRYVLFSSMNINDSKFKNEISKIKDLLEIIRQKVS
jgi:hypothetical protein